MANMASYLEEEVLQEKLVDATVYVGLVEDSATDVDLESGDLTNEITGYDGDRKAISFTAPSQVSGKGTVQNDVQIDFENMPATTVEYAIICDSATGGNILYWCPAINNKTTNSGDTYRVDTNDLTIDQD